MYEINCYDSYGNTIDYLTQWDYNRKLIMYIEHYDLSYAPEVHFCNQNSLEALVVQSVVDGNKLTVDIPNILLQEHLSICAYVYLSDANNASSQKTILSVTIPVRYRPKPSEYTYTENITKVTAAQIEENIYNKLKDDLLMIESVEQTKFGNDNNGINVYTVTLTDGTSSEFQFRDGVDSVYVGSGEMPENCNFQIDPSGDTDDRVDGLVTSAEFNAHISEGSKHVTQEEKEVWNNKSNFSGYYRDLIGAPSIPSIPSLDGYATNEYVQERTKDLVHQNDFEKHSISMSKMLNAIRRKILSISGNLSDIQRRWNSDNEYCTCRVKTVTEEYIDINISGAAFKRDIRLSVKQGDASLYEISMLSGWGFNRKSIYGATSTNKRIVDVNIEDVRYTNIDVLKTVGFNFRSAVINYDVVNGTALVGHVTLSISPECIQICETTANTSDSVTTCITGNYVSPVAQHGSNLYVFTMNNGKRYYTEKIEKFGNTVLKTFGLKGVF